MSKQAESANAKIIDVRGIMRSKMGNKADKVPGFIISYLQKILHEEQVNEFLIENDGIVGTPWLESCISYLKLSFNIEGLDNLPAKDDTKRYTFVSNHPLGGMDGVAIASILGKQYDDQIRLLVNDFLMNLPGLAPLCIGINKTGAQSRSFPALVEEGFSGDMHMMMFPAGICSRKINGKIQDLPWKKTFISKSIQYQRDIVPIHFIGRNSDFFYRLANFSDKYIKKVNVAMIYLVDELYKNIGKTFTIKIGKPIPWQTFDKSKTPVEWAQYVRSLVYEL
ncbi:MAG: glycerol acyltransferase [Prevotella sp.]|nr:glycerol acyltransferase [Prevotella sp.]